MIKSDMTYKEAIGVALTSIGYSEDKIRNHNYGQGQGLPSKWVYEHRREMLDELYAAKVKLRKLASTL